MDYDKELGKLETLLKCCSEDHFVDLIDSATEDGVFMEPFQSELHEKAIEIDDDIKELRLLLEGQIEELEERQKLSNALDEAD